MEKQMYNSLKSIQMEFNEINEKMNDPKIINNIKSYTKLSRKANNIEDIVNSFVVYEKLSKTVSEGKALLKTEKDEELLLMIKKEIEESEQKSIVVENKIRVLLVPKDANDEKNVIVEMRGAAGGDEANIFVGDLFDIYKKWSALNNMKLNVIESQKSNAGGFTQLVFKIEGEKAYSKLKFESGVHRVQRVPATETQGRVHTSTVTVTVMPEADETVEIEINPVDLKIDTFRASGAGGQSVNTTDSAVRITHLETGIVVSSQDERSQLQNKHTCLKLLKTKLYDIEVQKAQDEDAAFRNLAGSGARSEKVRTYNYAQDRVTDHRAALSVSLKSVIDGKINTIIETLQAAEQAARIKEAGL